MILGLLGNTDNRLVMYSILKILENKGDVVLITPNEHLLRLLEDPDSRMGYFGNTLIVVTSLSADEVWEDIGHVEFDFDHIIYDLKNTVADSVQTYIHCYDYGIDENEEDFLNMIKDFTEIEHIKLSYDGKRDKTHNNVRVTFKDVQAITKAEHLGELGSIQNKTLTDTLAKLIGKQIKADAKAMSAMLKKGRGTVK